jgi:hypothetical protein
MTATVRTPDHDQRGPRESSHAAQPRIAFRREHGILVLRPVGTLDRRLTERLRRAVLDASRPVAVDLDTCDVEPAALDRIAVDPKLFSVPELCLVARSPGRRDQLGRAGLDRRFALFATVDDALQARAFARAGYGPGWTRPEVS